MAFPNDEASAEVMASRLRDAGIPARVDRGLYGSYQVTPRNQMTVLVAERDARRASDLLGIAPVGQRTSVVLLRIAIGVVVLAIAVGLVVIAALLAR